MENRLKNYRSMLLINGIIGLLFGLFALFVTEPTLVTFGKFFGLVLVIGGAIGIFASVSNKKNARNYVFSLLVSIFCILIGLVIFIFTQKSLEYFVMVIGIWSVAIAISQMWIAYKHTKKGPNQTILIINGLITLIFGIVLFMNPFTSLITLFSVMGIVAIIFGGILIYASIVLRPVREKV